MEFRCAWAGSDPLYVAYHDQEWGVPLHDDNRLFEFLILEAAQAGLSWRTVLNKREGYRKAFHDFDPMKVAKVSVNTPGPIRPVIPRMLVFAPWRCPCCDGSTRRVMIPCAAGP